MSMSKKKENGRTSEIEAIYKSIGLQSEDVRKYFVALGSVPSEASKQKPAIFIEAGTNSMSAERFGDARLEPITQ